MTLPQAKNLSREMRDRGFQAVHITRELDKLEGHYVDGWVVTGEARVNPSSSHRTPFSIRSSSQGRAFVSQFAHMQREPVRS